MYIEWIPPSTKVATGMAGERGTVPLWLFIRIQFILLLWGFCVQHKEKSTVQWLSFVYRLLEYNQPVNKTRIATEQ